MNMELLKEAGIDVASGLRRFMNNEMTFRKFLVKFLDNTLYNELKEQVKDGNVEEAFQKAHALKGVCSNLSLSGILEPLDAIVELLRTGTLNGVPELLEEVEEAYQKVIQAIEES